MSNNPLRLQILLKKYLENNISTTELEEFWVLMAAVSENDLVENELMQLWDNEGYENTNRDWEQVFGELKSRIEENEINYLKVNSSKSVKLWKQMAVAASFIIAISATYLFINHQNNAEKLASTQKKNYELPVLNHQVINLPDGSVVTLNHDSKLNYPASFDGKTREVYLVGEAFFDIKHNPSKPFIVHTGKYFTQVLGTAFNIKAFKDDKQISVTVTRGKVKVERQDDKKLISVLLPGDQLKIADTTSFNDSKSIEPLKVDIAKILEWKNEELVFDNTTFDEAGIILNNSFGIKIKLANSALRNCKFSGKFKNDNLEKILKIITELTQTNYKLEKNEVLITGKGCN